MTMNRIKSLYIECGVFAATPPHCISLPGMSPAETCLPVFGSSTGA